jgi:hypothetical protein
MKECNAQVRVCSKVPSCQVINQSRITRDDIKIYPDVHLLASKLCPHCDDSLTWWFTHQLAYTIQTLHKGAVRTNTRWGYTSHHHSTRVAFGTSPGNKPKNPSQLRSGVATNNHQLVPRLHSCYKLSRWQQPLRVTRKPQQIDPQVTLDAITQANALWITPNSLGCTIKQEIEWERFGLAHKDVSMIKMSKRVS